MTFNCINLYDIFNIAIKQKNNIKVIPKIEYKILNTHFMKVLHINDYRLHIFNHYYLKFHKISTN